MVVRQTGKPGYRAVAILTEDEAGEQLYVLKWLPI